MTLMLEKAIYGCSYFVSMLVEDSMQMRPQFEVQPFVDNHSIQE
jgi:hypothetical protein